MNIFAKHGEIQYTEHAKTGNAALGKMVRLTPVVGSRSSVRPTATEILLHYFKG